MKVKAISVVGLGKLGLCTAAIFAKKGYKVIGVDNETTKVSLINAGGNPIKETDLDKTLSQGRNNLRATTSYKEAILNTQVTFIIVPTPSKEDGSFSNQFLSSALSEIGAALKDKTDYHLVVITSTVMPGTSRDLATVILEDISKKKSGRDFGIAYNPEFIALGSVIYDFLNPDFILIGENDRMDGDTLEEIYNNVCENNPKFGRMNLISAEIAKIALNCYITMKITYANTLGAICEKVSGADAIAITEAIGMDSRIGKKYLKPGLGYGGPCFPRDNRAFVSFAEAVGAEAKLAKTVDLVNNLQVDRIVKKVLALRKGYGVVGVLGLTYKPNTHIVEESQAIEIAKRLAETDMPVIVYDPQSMEEARKVLKETVGYRDFQDFIDEADILIIATPWDEFKDIKIGEGVKVIDCWGILKI